MPSGNGLALALADTGEIMHYAYCNSHGEVYARFSDQYAKFHNHFPRGHQLEYVKDEDISNHKGLQEAMEKHRARSTPNNNESAARHL